MDEQLFAVTDGVLLIFVVAWLVSLILWGVYMRNLNKLKLDTRGQKYGDRRAGEATRLAVTARDPVVRIPPPPPPPKRLEPVETADERRRRLAKERQRKHRAKLAARRRA